MMNIIIVSKMLRSPKKFSLGDPKIAAMLGGGLLAMVGLGFGAGFLTRGADGAGQAQVTRLQHQLHQQKADLDAAREDAQRDVNAVAARVGRLQAESNRLNALGVRLTHDAKISGDEFNFDKVPGQGGGDEAVQDISSKDLLQGLDQLEAKFKDSGDQLSVLESMMYSEQLQAAAIPSGRPTPGYITSGFGTRTDPLRGGIGHHMGIDFDANIGDPVHAAAGGVVVFSGVKSGFGNVVEVDHGNGYTTLYGHNSRLLVRAGDIVRTGQTLAKAGSTGRSTGPHVHFEVHVNGRPVDPRKFLARVTG